MPQPKSSSDKVNGANEPLLQEVNEEFFFYVGMGDIASLKKLSSISTKWEMIKNETEVFDIAVFMACRSNHLELLEWLVENGAKLSITQTIKGSEPQTPLSLAKLHKNNEMGAYILAHTTVVSSSGFYGCTEKS